MPLSVAGALLSAIVLPRGRSGGAGVFVALLLLAPSLSPAEEAAADSSVAGPTPRGALWRSLLLPGWGQFYNGKPLKGLVLGGISAGLAVGALRAANDVDGAPTPEIHQDRAARRNTRILYVAMAFTVSALDAYIDAHLATLDVDLALLSLEGGGGLVLRVPWIPQNGGNGP